MWERCGRFLLALPVLFLLSFSAYSAELNPLETGVREWAADKDKEQVVEKLIAAVLKVESLETRFATVEEKLKLAEEKQASSLMSFEESLRLKNLEIAAATRRLWMDRIKWAAGGLLAGAATALAWNILH